LDGDIFLEKFNYAHGALKPAPPGHPGIGWRILNWMLAARQLSDPGRKASEEAQPA
jgi:hypothetical protein